MNTIKTAAVALWNAEDGLTTVEYAIAGSLVGAAVIAAFTQLGGKVAGVIMYLVNNINAP